MNRMTRREALTTLCVVPLAAALGVSPAVAERALIAAERAATNRKLAGVEYEPVFFTPAEWRLVRVLVDLVIPADERSGAATDAGVPEFMDFTLDDRPEMRDRVRNGLAWLDAESGRRYGSAFVEAAEAQRTAILDDIAWPARALPEMQEGVAFFNSFRDMTASGFFSSRIGVEDLGYTGNTFVREWTGCPPEALERLGVSYDVPEGIRG